MTGVFLFLAGALIGCVYNRWASHARNEYDTGFHDGVMAERYSAYAPWVIAESGMHDPVERARSVF